ncbi:hypothetical protein RKE30_26825 [Streptomyces sp. Li-HN-5-11]|nr:hypothetical protein [Streptomyces sp. Li-HN-5-11]WNM33735.1 hypothetical protein RKE30_26825 [Streptomyces sp. Li-HN-5-11]
MLDFLTSRHLWIATAVGVLVSELWEKRLTAEVGDDDQLSGWQLA